MSVWSNAGSISNHSKTLPSSILYAPSLMYATDCAYWHIIMHHRCLQCGNMNTLLKSIFHTHFKLR